MEATRSGTIQTSGVSVLDAGIVSCLGVSPQAVLTAARGQVSGIASTSIRGKSLRKIRLGCIPTGALPPLADPIVQELRHSQFYQRLIQLSDAALRQAGARLDGRAVPLFIGLPSDDGLAPWKIDVPTLCAHLSAQTAVSLCPATSRAFLEGRASGFYSVGAALQYLGQHGGLALVGAVDTYVNPGILATYDADDRLLGGAVRDGFVAGEGAAFMLLGCGGVPGAGAVAIDAVGLGFEPGHRRSAEPCRGDGLTAAMATLFAGLPATSLPIRTVFAGLIGEHFDTKEWNYARLRHRQHFVSELGVEHPAEYFGDVGAALGMTLMVMAAAGLAHGLLDGPVLTWGSSDTGQRGAARLVHVAPQGAA